MYNNLGNIGGTRHSGRRRRGILEAATIEYKQQNIRSQYCYQAGLYYLVEINVC